MRATRRLRGAVSAARWTLGLIVGGMLAACSPAMRVQSLDGESMGSIWALRYVGTRDSVEDVRSAVQQRLDLVDRQMSTWKADSDLSRFNSAQADTWCELPPELFTVVQSALKLAAETDGAYDPTVGPLVDLWGFGADGERSEPPSQAAIRNVRERIGWQRLGIDADKHSAYQQGGTHIDLSSIAPGFALDLIGEYLESQGIVDYLVEVGGELRGRGSRPDGNAWRVAIQRPVDNDSVDGSIEAQHVLDLVDASLGSSGDYRHFFEDKGRRYAHRIDPRTGYPVDNAIASVTVMSALGIDADPLATALSVLGVEAGLEFANRRGLAVMFIVRTDHGFEERMTPAFAALLQ
ncbi:FAD:protein FMN transferase [Dokdonella sp.]|uniref:FAD:protein FMN transferase n=1 Tax=Dokdonella sp. TaxID=2291710 RepID=UPI003527DE3A